MLNDEQKGVVDALLNYRTPSHAEYHYHSLIGFMVDMKGTTWQQQDRERKTKETEIRRLLTETFPTWKVEKFKEHHLTQMFPGHWLANIYMLEHWHSLLSLAYYLRWSRQGLIIKDFYNAAALDPRYSEWEVKKAMREAEDPVQWVTDTYGDTLENQFPVLVHTGPMGSSGYYLVVANPQEDVCEETIRYVAPESFLDRLNIEYELEWTAAINIQVDEKMIVTTWKSKLARKVFEERHPECL